MPIPLNESSELSALLADVVAGGDDGHRERTRERHAAALKRLSKALAPDAEVPEQREDNRVAGVVIVFQTAEAEAEAETPEAEAEAEIVLRAPSLAAVEIPRETPAAAGLEADRFVLCAQPVLQLASNAVVQHELLLRMTGTDGALLLPRAFLPAMAEAA